MFPKLSLCFPPAFPRRGDVQVEVVLGRDLLAVELRDPVLPQQPEAGPVVGRALFLRSEAWVSSDDSSVELLIIFLLCQLHNKTPMKLHQLVQLLKHRADSISVN